MLDSLILLGIGVALLGVIALANPILVGWRSRRDAARVLAVAVVLLGLGWLARLLQSCL
jgi:hypothetical protein